jgi:hypothetical protein
MSKQKIEFNPEDWIIGPELRAASLPAKAIWATALAWIINASRKGQEGINGPIEGLARLCACDPNEFESFLAEAEQLGFADVQRRGDGNVTLRARNLRGREK